MNRNEQGKDSPTINVREEKDLSHRRTAVSHPARHNGLYNNLKSDNVAVSETGLTGAKQDPDISLAVLCTVKGKIGQLSPSSLA